MSFYEKWIEASSIKRSILCAGLDVPAFGMTGTPFSKTSNRIEWALKYIDAVTPYVCAVKLNLKYWLYEPNVTSILSYVKEKKLLLIVDSKLADIGSTNDAEYHSQSLLKVDAVTISPLAGNIRETVLDCRKRNLDCFVMALMSNPEYATMKHALVPLESSWVQKYAEKDIVRVGNQPYAKLFLYLTKESVGAGATGLVVGTTGHITVDEIALVRDYSTDKTLYLCPGIGSQGGDAKKIADIVNPKRLIVSIGRTLMFPNGADVEPEDHRRAAADYRDALRRLVDWR